MRADGLAGPRTPRGGKKAIRTHPGRTTRGDERWVGPCVAKPLGHAPLSLGLHLTYAKLEVLRVLRRRTRTFVPSKEPLLIVGICTAARHALMKPVLIPIRLGLRAYISLV